MVKYNTIASIDVGSSRKRRFAEQTSTTVEEQLSLLQEAIDSTVLDTATAHALIDQAGNVAVTDLTLSDAGERDGRLYLYTVAAPGFKKWGGKKGATIDYGGANMSRFFWIAGVWFFLGKHVRGAHIASA